MNNARTIFFVIAACLMMLLSGFVLAPEIDKEASAGEPGEGQASSGSPPVSDGPMPWRMSLDERSQVTSIPHMPGTRGKWNEMLNTSFEGAGWNSGWSLRDQDSGSGDDYWYRDLTTPRTGLYSLNCSAGPVGTGGNGVGYDNNMNAWAVYGTFNLTNALAATYTFWVNMSVEKNAAGWDKFFYGTNVEAADGLTYYGYILTGNRTWTQYTVDLAKYDGTSRSAIGKKNVSFAFVFQSNGSVCGDVGYHGAFVDDVVLMNKTNVAPNKPINLGVVAPTIRRVTDQEPTMKWEFSDPDGTKWEAQSRYQIQVSDDDDFSDIATDKMWDHNETSSTYGQLKYSKYNRTGTAKGMQDGQTYYFRVKTRDADDLWGDWSDIFNFTHNDNPSTPTILTPSGSSLMLTGGDKVNITFTVSKNDLDYAPIDPISINISYGPSASGPWTSIVTGKSNNGTYNPWTVPASVEYPTAHLRVTAWDGYEETHAYFGPFVIDNFAPVINSINVTSDKPNMYVQSMGATGGTVWFNSLAGLGSGQKISVVVNWTDATKTQLSGTAVFDGVKTITTPPYSTMIYTVSVTDNANVTLDITVSDYKSRTDTAQIKFNADNTPPNAPVSVDCHADVVGDKMAYDDDQQFFVSWVNGTDSLSGLGKCKVGLANPPTILTSNNTANFTVGVKNATVFAYVQMMDRVGNLGAVGMDNISIDFSIPAGPVVSSLTHPDPLKYYSNNDPTFYWVPPAELSGIAGYGHKIDGLSDTTAPSVSQGAQNYTSATEQADGVWYLHVKALDLVGYWGNTSHFKFGIDTTPPAITNLTPAKVNTGQRLDLKFTATDILSGVDTTSGLLYWKHTGEAQYTVQAMTFGTEFLAQLDIPSNSTANIEYHFTVNDSAITPNMARFPPSGDVLVNVLDGIAPRIANVTGNVTAGTGSTQSVHATVTDNVAVLEVRMQLSGKPPVVMAKSGDEYSCDMAIPADSTADIAYSIWAMDTSGMTSATTDFKVKVQDTIAPIIDDVTGNTTGTPGKPVTIYLSAYDNIDGPENLVPIVHIIDGDVEDEYEMTYQDAVWSINVNMKPTQKMDLLYYVTLADSAGNKAWMPEVNGTHYYIFLPIISSPAKDEVFAKAVDIDWSAKNLTGYDVLVSLYSRGASSSTWTTIDTNLENTGHYSWNVSMFDNGEYYVKVKVVYASIERMLTSEVESNRFYVYNPHKPIATLSAPKRGTYYDDLPITWTCSDKDPGETLAVGVYYKLAAEANWSELATGLTGADTTYTWDTTKFADGTYLIKVEATDSSLFALKAFAQQDGIVINNTLNMDVTLKDIQPVKASGEFTWKVYIYDNVKPYDPPSEVSEEVIVSYSFEGGPFVEAGRVQKDSGGYTWDVSKLKDGKYQVKFQYVAENGKTAEKLLDVEVYNNLGGGGDTDSNSMWWIILIVAAVVVVLIIIVIIVLMRRKKKDEEPEEKADKKKAKGPEEESLSGPAGPEVPDASLPPVPDTTPALPDELYTGIMPAGDSSPYSAIAQDSAPPAEAAPPELIPLTEQPAMGSPAESPALPPAQPSAQAAAKPGAQAPAKPAAGQPAAASAKPATSEEKRKNFDDIFSGI